MSSRRNFNLKYIENELNKISSRLSKQLTVYVAGGCAMAYYGLKEATKDIDAVLLTEKESELLVCSLLRAGYHHLDTLVLSGAYRSMQASSTVENQDGFRWDVFTKRVANTLSLTEPMMKRGKEIYETGKRSLFLFQRRTFFS